METLPRNSKTPQNSNGYKRWKWIIIITFSFIHKHLMIRPHQVYNVKIDVSYYMFKYSIYEVKLEDPGLQEWGLNFWPKFYIFFQPV